MVQYKKILRKYIATGTCLFKNQRVNKLQEFISFNYLVLFFKPILHIPIYIILKCKTQLHSVARIILSKYV